MSDSVPNPDLTALESALTALRPLPDRLNRDQLMFEAGRLSGRRWTWPAATGVLTVACLALGGALVFQTSPAPIIRIVSDPAVPPAAVPRRTPALPPAAGIASVPPAAGEEPAVDVTNALRLRELVLRFGVDALPDRTSPPAALGQVPVSDWPADFSARPLLLRPLFRTPGDPS